MAGLQKHNVKLKNSFIGELSQNKRKENKSGENNPKLQLHMETTHKQEHGNEGRHGKEQR